MQSLERYFEHLLQDCGKRCGVPILRSAKTARRRAEHEGDSFYTITLPGFCRDFERSLDVGKVGPAAFPNFGRSGGIPAFLSEFLSLVFSSTGLLLGEPNHSAISSVRQLCLFAKKIERDCTPRRKVTAEHKFIECEREVKNHLPSWFRATYERTCSIVSSSILSVDWYEGVIPRHGSGAVGERILGNKKYAFPRWHERLEREFPYTEFGTGSVRNWEAGGHFPDFVEPGDEQPVRVVFVPKTLKTPRVIAIEPTCMQYMQQALMTWLVPRIESGHYTAGRVNFTRQDVNQSIARESSVSGRLATVDMSEASDRVSCAMAAPLFRTCPDLLRAVFAARSTSALLPSGNKIRLRKFASMGSAMCFPVEAMVFYCAIVAYRVHAASKTVTAQSVYKYGRDVYVYGDDICVPADEAPQICSFLETFGLKVNTHKSFWSGKFRESCGEDYYDGSRVTPVYLRQDVPQDLADVAGIVSCVATANQLAKAGYWRTADLLRKEVEAVTGSLPMVSETSQAVGWTWYSNYDPPVRYNKLLHRVEMRCWVTVPKKISDPLEGDHALLKCFRLIGTKDAVDPEHLLRSVSPYAQTLKRRWVPLQ